MTVAPEILESIYQAYPRKVGKRSALKAIEKAIGRLVTKREYKNKPLTEEEAIAGLLNRTKMYADSPAGQRKTFTPHPTTWYNQARYCDDPKEWQHQDNRAVERDDRVKDTINRVLGGRGRARSAAVGSSEAGGPERSGDRLLGEGSGSVRAEDD